MNVFRLLYVSRAVRKPDLSALTDIIKAASLRNLQAGVTGVLCCADPYFIQVLEGPVGAVNRVLGRIARDPRHTDLTITSAGAAAVRLFPNWGMRLIQPVDAPGGEYARLFAEPPGGARSPAEVEPTALLAFLRRLADHAPPQQV